MGKLIDPDFHVINLAKMTGRWQTLQDSFAGLGLGERLRRVEAVDGRLIARDAWTGFDQSEFERRNGRKCLAGEYGCYRSHLRALATIAEGSAEAAVILEDDVCVTPKAVARIKSLIALIASESPIQPMIIKLVNHRVRFFRRVMRTAMGDAVGKALHGPYGSSAGYLLTKPAAALLLRTIGEMREPYDIALEAGWRSQVQVLSVENNVVTLGAQANASSIASHAEMQRTKFPELRRISCYVHRTAEYLRRVRYALG